MPGRSRLARVFVLFCIVLMAALPLGVSAGDKGSADYTTGIQTWDTEEFGRWALSKAVLDANGAITIDPGAAKPETDPYPAGGYYGGNFYNAGSFVVGEATSPVVESTFAFHEAIASWNADTPPETWVETLIRADIGGRWTKWYNLGVWASDFSTVERHSVRLQGDGDGFVAVDTLVVTNKTAATAYQLKLRLFSANDAAPTVRYAAVATSTTPGKKPALQSGDPDYWNTILQVPECSQMVYPDGGEVWCSPTSTSMVLGYWEQHATGSTADCETRVRAAVDGVYDWLYDGHGNWPFNTAYAGSLGYEAYVARFSSFAQAEPWIDAGVPVVFSFAWKKGSLTGAAIPSSNGHLSVLVGFDAAGNPIVNDPAAASDGDVQRTYLRSELESLWLEASGGTVYLIYPQDHAVPAS